MQAQWQDDKEVRVLVWRRRQVERTTGLGKTVRQLALRTVPHHARPLQFILCT